MANAIQKSSRIRGACGEDQCGGGDGRGIGGSDAEQLGLDELAEGGNARESDGQNMHRDFTWLRAR